MDKIININLISSPALVVDQKGEILEINTPLSSLISIKAIKRTYHLSDILLDLKGRDMLDTYIAESRLINQNHERYLAMCIKITGSKIIIIIMPTDMSINSTDLYNRANYDPLTKLANRSLLLNRFEISLELASRDNLGLALFFIDLDGFKKINDNYGHIIGDRYLCETGDILLQSFRKTDTVARWGGDEFLILCTNFKDLNDIKRLCERIINSSSVKIKIDNNHELDIELSIGVSMYPKDGSDTKTLINNADKAMYHAKSLKGSAYNIL